MVYDIRHVRRLFRKGVTITVGVILKGFLTTTLNYIFKSETQFHSDVSSFQCDWSAKIKSAL